MALSISSAFRCSLAGLSMALLASAASAASTTGDAVRLADAIGMARGAVEAVARKGGNVSIVIVNGEGRVILSQRMDGASFMSLDVAQAKAVTAAALGVPTKMLEKQLASGDHSALSVQGASTIAGGLPVVVRGKTIAAVGVSGGMPDDDEAVAAVARDIFLRTTAQ